MTRPILALCLWCLCGLVGLFTARRIALNVESEQRLEDKRAALLWSEEVNSNLRIQIEEISLELEEEHGVSEVVEEVGGSE